jgi:hypothetical protein
MSQGKNNLLQFILNQGSATTYGSSKNYGIEDLTYEGAIRRATRADFDHQAYVQSGVGYKAIILSYTDQGLNVLSMNGETNTPPESPTPTPTPPTPTPEENPPNNGVPGEVPNNTPTPLPDAANQALTQISFLNGVEMKVWIPLLNTDVPTPFIKTDPNVGIRIIDEELYETCSVNSEKFLQALPPPGSLVRVDYENRQTKTGLNLKGVICRDPNFARIILSELSGLDITEESLAELFANIPPFSGGFAFGDMMGSLAPAWPAQPPEKIAELALNYDNDATLPNKSQHAPYFPIAHPEFVPYMKAFMFKCWSDQRAKIRINSVYRTPQKQAELLAKWKRKGGTGPKPGKTSYHLYGMAIDFNPTLATGRMLMSDDPVALWQQAGIVAAGEAVNLYWGGRFRGNYDPIHFDFRNVAGSGTSLARKVEEQNIPGSPNRVKYA